MTNKLNNNTNTPAPTFCTVEALLTQDRYSIPMYQRNYAWADQEISQLIDDVLDYQTKTRNNDNYYIGTLVVYKKSGHQAGENNCYEVIDGQQRLTTLTLLAMYLKNYAATDAAAWYQNKALNLSFECRSNSTFTLQALFDNEDFSQYTHSDDEAADARINSDILNGYKIIEKTLIAKINERNSKIDELGSKLVAFSDYVRQHIKILRVEVPKDTDLNHYFEVMNNRGEQLEKHEIIKARLLECVQADSHAVSVINAVWEGVANMEKYIQSTFSTGMRAKIFGKNYDGFVPTDFETLGGFFDNAKTSDETKAPEDTRQTIMDILANDAVAVQDNTYSKDNDDGERFRPVINFPNFLLQVLRIYIYGIQKIAPSFNNDDKVNDTVSLDDKALIDAFEEHILRHKDANKVKAFIFYLLKSKFVFDKYIIKRQYQHGDENWSLKKYIRSDESANVNNTFGKDEAAASRGEGNNDARSIQNQQNIVMLLASFHVSIPSMSYKYWLNGALTWLMLHDDDTQITATDYLAYLQGMAQSFVFDRYLNNEPMDYYHIVYSNHCQPQNLPNSIAAINTELLKYGRIKNNFVFNYLDYLIWRKKCDSDAVYKRFEFIFRSSVEHFYPQTAHTFESMEKEARDRFGNLFLITHSQNSSFSNKRPLAKLGEIKGQYLTSSDIAPAVPSLKLIELAKALRPQWDDNTESAEKYAAIFEQHEKEMLTLYLEG